MKIRYQSRSGNRFVAAVAVCAVMMLIFLGCGSSGSGTTESGRTDGDGSEGGAGGTGGTGGGGGTVTTGDLVVLAWNDLGMHCLNPTYDRLIILPPYNTLWAQVIERGNPPRVVTNGIRVSYAIMNNTTSLNKLSYDQFWDPGSLALFGADGLAQDTGLNLHDPAVHNGLAGDMQPAGDHFVAEGIPLTPVADGTVTKDPYQVAVITVKGTGNTTLVQTHAMAPTSDEINCGKCHAPGGTVSDAFIDILQKHDDAEGTSLQASAPVLCAGCHDSPVLGVSGAGTYLSQVIHGFHAGRTAPGGTPIACYDCHPGQTTQCNRSLRHTAADGDCITCHGTMDDKAAAIAGGKVPWVDEPQCSDCHNTVQGVDTGATLYRNATGHGGLYCPACHQSPHAMVPSREATDNFQAQQYQGASVSMGSCGACHGSSKPEGGNLSEFRQEHAGTNPERLSACGVCHTALPSNVSAAEFPHQFTWNAR